MEVVHIGKGTDILSTIPTPPVYFDGPTKKHYRALAKLLITAKILKGIHLPALEILAQNKAQHEFALRSIHKKNNRKAGTGYIQTFKSGAANITDEITLKEKAERAMFQCIKQFGLDPKAEKDLNLEPANQTNLLEALGLTQSSKSI